MNDPLIIVLIFIFGMPVAVAIAVLFAMRSMDKQQKEMEKENEEYYQKMKSGTENPGVNRMKREDKIDHWVHTIHGRQPVCKCGSFLFMVGEEPEWVCIKCEPEKIRGT